jgi:hypothetical protein
MDVLKAVEMIKQKFSKHGGSTRIPLLKGASFTATLTKEGIAVDNLRSQPFLPWAVFQEAVCLLVRKGGQADRGDAMGSKLGEPGLPLDSIEGHIAQVVFGKRPGDSVFRRVTPIACILIWAGICEAAPNKIILRERN